MTGTFYYLDCQCESAMRLRSGDHVPTSVDDEVVAYRCVKVAQHLKWSHSQEELDRCVDESDVRAKSMIAVDSRNFHAIKIPAAIFTKKYAVYGNTICSGTKVNKTGIWVLTFRSSFCLGGFLPVVPCDLHHCCDKGCGTFKYREVPQRCIQGMQIVRFPDNTLEKINVLRGRLTYIILKK